MYAPGELERKNQAGFFLLGGIIGTKLIACGIEAGVCNDYLNVDRPKIISDIHRSYFAVGSDAVITNTFGANEYALRRHGFAGEVVKINKAGGQIARNIAGQERYVLGDIGPSGDFLEPLGALKAEDLREAFLSSIGEIFCDLVDSFLSCTLVFSNDLTAVISN
jgi:5-methyltetrahydrofolate--homocysteine methyltransferase